MKEEYDFTKDKTFDVYTIEELLEQYKDNDYYNLSKIENITKLCEEIKRLNNIINEFDDFIINIDNHINLGDESEEFILVRDKWLELQKLKGVDKK